MLRSVQASMPPSTPSPVLFTRQLPMTPKILSPQQTLLQKKISDLQVLPLRATTSNPEVLDPQVLVLMFSQHQTLVLPALEVLEALPRLATVEAFLHLATVETLHLLAHPPLTFAPTLSNLNKEMVSLDRAPHLRTQEIVHQSKVWKETH